MSVIKIMGDFFKNLFKKTTQDNSDNSNNTENSKTMPAQIVRLGH